MIRALVIFLSLWGTLLNADEPLRFALAAPDGWGGETITLPPGFAPDMSLKGVEHIRFAPGMMNPRSDSFFSYAFAFEVQLRPALTELVVKEEFLKYYRGLCKAVLNGRLPDLDPSRFSLDLTRVEPTASTDSVEAKPLNATQYSGVLDWIEPFATRTPQKLYLEIHTWSKKDHNYIFACVSPHAGESHIWNQLRAIRSGYLTD